ncbi:hypothetical protein GH733_011343 [Mirounga leonina]|nr:hypothetical protein GH733_011343 [Mirounga leonina]
MNIMLALNIKITTYHTAGGWLESGMLNTSIPTKTTSSYSVQLQLCQGLQLLQLLSFSKAMVVKKIETRNGKLLSESSDVLSK